MLEVVKTIVTTYIIFILIAFVWRIAEKEIYGHITTRPIDTIVAVILAISLYFNFK